MSYVLVLQHFPCETPGLIADSLDAAGITARYLRTFEGQPVPEDMADAAGLIVMGGPMGVYEQDRYPFLRDEMRLIEKALRADLPTLGVCLGSQLIAVALGAAVTKGRQKELGWHEVTLTEQAAADPLFAGVSSPFTAFHWHGDIVSLPSGAVPLASSHLTEHQAFRHGRAVYGLLFHLEVTAPMVSDLVTSFAEEAHASGVDGSAIAAQAAGHLPDIHCVGSLVFRRWATQLHHAQ